MEFAKRPVNLVITLLLMITARSYLITVITSTLLMKFASLVTLTTNLMVLVNASSQLVHLVRSSITTICVFLCLLTALNTTPQRESVLVATPINTKL